LEFCSLFLFLQAGLVGFLKKATPIDKKPSLKTNVDKLDINGSVKSSEKTDKEKKVKVTAVESLEESEKNEISPKPRKLKKISVQDIADKINQTKKRTVRSTRGKYVDTPFGIFELKSFFTSTVELGDGQVVSNREAKKSLKELIENEDKKKPITDEKILALMKDRGFPLARRTIAKYRKQLNFPVARLRRII
jgi:RNA polymerase sigma-54 factor